MEKIVDTKRFIFIEKSFLPGFWRKKKSLVQRHFQTTMVLDFAYIKSFTSTRFRQICCIKNIYDAFLILVNGISEYILPSSHTQVLLFYNRVMCWWLAWSVELSNFFGNACYPSFLIAIEELISLSVKWKEHVCICIFIQSYMI